MVDQGTENIFSEIIAKSFQNLGKYMNIKVQKNLELQTQMTRKELTHVIL
jgi:hypothetical protein